MQKIGVTDIPPSYGDILYTINRKKNICIKDISEISNKDKSTVSLIINALEKNGYVKKEKNNTDGRSITIKLTQKAKQYTDAMMEISIKLQNKLFAEMSEEEKAIFFMLLQKVAKKM